MWTGSTLVEAPGVMTWIVPAPTSATSSFPSAKSTSSGWINPEAMVHKGLLDVTPGGPAGLVEADAQGGSGVDVAVGLLGPPPAGLGNAAPW